VQVEDLWKDGRVDSALTQGMGKLLLMQQSKDLVRRDVYTVAYETLESAFSGPVDHFSYCRHETKREHFKLMKSCLTKPVEIPLHNCIIVEEERVRKKSDLYLSTSLSSKPELSSLKIPEYAYNLFRHVRYFSISDGRIRILNYRDIVRTIYCFLCRTELQEEQLDVSYYETEIYKFEDLKEGQAAMRRQDLPKELQEDIEKRAFMMYKVITAKKNNTEAIKVFFKGIRVMKKSETSGGMVKL